MFLWMFQITDFYKYIPCNISKWKAYQYLSKEYPNKTVIFLGKINNKGDAYVNNRTLYLTNLFKKIESVKKEANCYRTQGWKETPGWGLHHKDLTKSITELYTKLYGYPKILIVYNSWKLKTHNLIKE